MISVQVFDDMLGEPLKSQLIDAMSWMPVHFLNRRERYQTHDFDIHWYYPLAVSDDGDRGNVETMLDSFDEHLGCVKQCWERVKASFSCPVRLYECSLSANAFGTEGSVHHDIPVPSARPRHHTVLVYCNAKWDIAWAGETLVFDADESIVSAVTPKPGRLVRISGDPLHVGRSVSRTCPTDRRVLVFKLWEMDEPQSGARHPSS